MNTYTVKPGDTLSIIARDVLGSMDLWQYLASINNIESPYTVYPGQELKTDVAEVTADPWPVPKGLIIGVIAAAAGIYYRKKIISFFKSLV